MFTVPNQYRVRNGMMGSDDDGGNNGLFAIKIDEKRFNVIASDGADWEHVSVSIHKGKRVPNWREMCHIKRLFWAPEAMVMQLHPRQSQYVDFHPYTLHLWRPIGQEIPEPPAILVGPR